MKDLIKVRIDKAKEHNWYFKEFIGEELMVKENEQDNMCYRFTKRKSILKSDCTVITEKEEPKTEPRLIAKAGEKVKIVDFGKASSWSFTLNKPYELREDLYFGGTFMVVEDDRKEKNGFSPIPEGMKFEKVSPMEEQKGERIPFDLEKLESGKYDVVSREGLTVEIIKKDLKSDEKLLCIYNLDENNQHAYALTPDGLGGRESEQLDLFLIPKTETVWVNVWHSEGYNSEADAKFMSTVEDIYKCTLMQTIEVKRPIKD